MNAVVFRQYISIGRFCTVIRHMQPQLHFHSIVIRDMQPQLHFHSIVRVLFAFSLSMPPVVSDNNSQLFSFMVSKK